MLYLLKLQQLCLVISLSLLLGITVCPPLLWGGIDPEQANIVLIGTAVSSDPVDNFAIIEDIESGQQWIYREGDLVGATLIKKIMPDHILVDNGNGEESVRLQRSLKSRAMGGKDASSPAAAVQTRHTPTHNNGFRDRYYLINGEIFAATFADPKQLLDIVDMQPGNLFNQQRGVRIGTFAPESLFAAFGLRQGDLLLAVNGQEIAAPGEAAAMLQTMLDEGVAELKVRRRARTYHFHLQAE